MIEAPAPLVPVDVDLRSFAYMPLDVVRLRDSDIAAIVSADAFRAAVILWCAAWHQMPAASLPADDASLARLAGYGRDIAAWCSVKHEALRGFVRCSDDRLYHPVIAEKALTAWGAKQARKAKTEAATAARMAKFEERQRDVDRDERRDVDRDVHQGKVREGNNSSSLHSEEISRSSRSSIRSRSASFRPEPTPRAHPYPDGAFATWYARFPRKKARQEAERAFRKIEAADKTPFALLLNGIEAFARDNPDVAFWPYPATWLNGRRWEDGPTKSEPTTVDAEGVPKVDLGGGVRWPEHAIRSQVSKWQRDPSTWPAILGPPPDAPGCRVPDHLLRMAA